MYEVHHLERSRSHRVLWLLEELELPYTVVRYSRDPVTMRAPAVLADVHPLAKSPVLCTDGLVLAESGAILTYLLEKHGSRGLARSAGDPTHARYLYWFHFAEGSATLPMSLLFHLGSADPLPVAKLEQAKDQLGRVLSYIDSSLRRDGYFADAAFSAADIQMSYPLESASLRGLLPQELGAIPDFLTRIADRPAYRRAVAAGLGDREPQTGKRS